MANELSGPDGSTSNPGAETPEDLRRQRLKIADEQQRRQQNKFGREDTKIGAGLGRTSAGAFKGSTLLGGG